MGTGAVVSAAEVRSSTAAIVAPQKQRSAAAGLTRALPPIGRPMTVHNSRTQSCRGYFLIVAGELA